MHFEPLPPAVTYMVRITTAGGLLSYIQKRDWELVLNARALPYRIVRVHGIEHLYVPALVEAIALHELRAYALENRKPQSAKFIYSPHKHCEFALIYLVPLVFCYLARVSLPTGALDGGRLWFHGEWWRLCTALTLHTGWVHLISNVFFGGLFLYLLARITGIGHAWLITLLAGIAGNLASAAVHTISYTSIGFSTAVFGSIGAVAGLKLFQHHQNLRMPLAAALALLAMLGTEGEHTDYAAHLFGVLCGFALGIIEGYDIVHKIRLLPQWLAATIAIAIPICAWLWASM